jgi:hypothetical protein
MDEDVAGQFPDSEEPSGIVGRQGHLAATTMARTDGPRLRHKTGPFEIESPLGASGMGINWAKELQK